VKRQRNDLVSVVSMCHLKMRIHRCHRAEQLVSLNSNRYRNMVIAIAGIFAAMLSEESAETPQNEKIIIGTVNYKDDDLEAMFAALE